MIQGHGYPTHLSPHELHIDANLIPLREEVTRLRDKSVSISLPHEERDGDVLDGAFLHTFLGFFLLLRLLIEELLEVDDLRHGRLGIGCDKHEVFVRLLRFAQSVLLRQDTDLMTLGVYDTQFWSFDAQIGGVVLARSPLYMSSRNDSQCERIIAE